MQLDGNQIHLHWLPWQRSHGRSSLRQALSGYLGVEPDRVAIVQDDATSKPRLAETCGDLRFNWSHSGSHALLAVARGCEVGVDLEQGSRQVNALPLARRFFAASEIALLEACDESLREHLFLRMWTGKEAVLKCLGEGLSYGLQRVIVDADANSLRLIDLAESGEDPHRWQLRVLPTPQRDLLAALAWQGQDRRLIQVAPGHDGARPDAP